MEDIPYSKDDVHKLFWLINGIVLQNTYNFKCITLISIIIESIDLASIRNSWRTFLTSYRDKELQGVPIWCPWPYFLLGKGFRWIPSISSDISVQLGKYYKWSWERLPNTWRTSLTPRMMPISNFRYTNGFSCKILNTLIYTTSLWLQN